MYKRNINFPIFSAAEGDLYQDTIVSRKTGLSLSKNQPINRICKSLLKKELKHSSFECCRHNLHVDVSNLYLQASKVE